MAKRVLIAAIGLILAAGIVSSLVSRQNLQASQNKSHAVSAGTRTGVRRSRNLPVPQRPSSRRRTPQNAWKSPLQKM